ncbi:putative uncharacterized protein C19orf81 homolog isoform X3 [Hyla sarda]|uniref:putative uncharacterized protein C19orf81 homolog isoform X3 n=1 Tax=Hyla sarda TaxID=327740 RepID=UPI0024C32A0D|nr:putative uncharacterized protein C19orf81 homolog isoform X3 [Hyla sarda]
MNKKLRKGGSKNKFTKKDFLEVDLNDLDQNVQQIQSEIAFLTETIRSKNNDLTYTLKTKEHHLKQIMQRSEELEPEKPCARTYPKPPPPQPLTLCMESPCIYKGKKQWQMSLCTWWLITASDFQVRDLLLQSGLDIDGGRFPLLRHDNIIVKDYKVHLRRALSKKKILAKLVDSTELSSTP